MTTLRVAQHDSWLVPAGEPVVTPRQVTRTEQTVQATQEEEAQTEYERVQSEKTSAWDLIGAATVQGTVGQLNHNSEEVKLIEKKAVEGYQLSPRILKSMEDQQLSTVQRTLLDRATSDEHADWLISLAVQNEMVQEDRSQFGFLANAGADALDPGMFAVDALTGGATKFARGGRVLNGIAAGTLAAAVNTGIQASNRTFDPNVSDDDLINTAATSFFLAGILGARKGSEYVPRKQNSVYTKAYAGDAKASLDDSVLDDELQSLSAAKRVDLNPNRTPGLDPLREPGAIEDGLEANARATEDNKVSFAAIRRDLSARFNKHPAASVRFVGSKLFRDGVGYVDKNVPVVETAPEMAKRLHVQSAEGYEKAMNTGLQAWKKRNGVTWINNEKIRGFRSEVGRAVRGETEVSPEAIQAAAGIRKVTADTWKIGHDNKVPGFETPAPPHKNWLPREMSVDAFGHHFGEGGLTADNVIKQLFVPALRNAWQATKDVTGDARTRAKLIEHQEIHAQAKGLAESAHARVESLHNSAESLREQLKQRAAKKPSQSAAKNATTARVTAELQEKLKRAESRLDDQKSKVHEMQRRLDTAQKSMDEMKATSVKPEIDEKLLHAVAKAMLRQGQAKLEGDSTQLFARGLPLDDISTLKNLLSEAGVSDADAVGILYRLKGKSDEAGVNPYSHHRVDLDETFRTTLTKDDGSTVEIGISDFLENDVEKLIFNYTKNVNGWAAMKSKLNVGNDVELNTLRNKLRQDSNAHLPGSWEDGKDAAGFGRVFQIAENSVFGRSTLRNPNGKTAKAARFLMDLQFPRVMNQVSFSMLAELGPMAQHAGLFNVIKSMPTAWRTMQRLADGTLADDDARVLSDFFTAGNDMVSHPFGLRLEDDIHGYVSGAKDSLAVKAGDAAYNGLEIAKRVTSYGSGMAPMQSFIQRATAGAMMRKLIDQANGLKMSAAEVNRLRHFGITEKAQADIFKTLKGVQRIKDIDADKIDFDTREAISAFLYRSTKKAVLEPDVADTFEIMHTLPGRILGQFRMFQVGSHTNHFLYALANLNDVRTFQMLSISMTMATLGWAAKTHLNTIGDPEKREKLMGGDNWQSKYFKAGFQQMSASAFLPIIADTITDDILTQAAGMDLEKELGFDPRFKNAARTTGNGTGLITGSAVGDFITRAVKSKQLLINGVRSDKQITRKQVEDASRLAVWSNFTGLQNILHKFTEGMPDDEDVAVPEEPEEIPEDAPAPQEQEIFPMEQ